MYCNHISRPFAHVTFIPFLQPKLFMISSTKLFWRAWTRGSAWSNCDAEASVELLNTDDLDGSRLCPVEVKDSGLTSDCGEETDSTMCTSVSIEDWDKTESITGLALVLSLFLICVRVFLNSRAPSLSFSRHFPSSVKNPNSGWSSNFLYTSSSYWNFMSSVVISLLLLMRLLKPDVNQSPAYISNLRSSKLGSSSGV